METNKKQGQQQQRTWDPLDLGVRVKKMLANATKPSEMQSDTLLPKHQATVRKMMTKKGGRVVDMSLRLKMPDKNGGFDEDSSEDDSEIDSRPRKKARQNSPPARKNENPSTAVERAKQELRRHQEREEEVDWNRFAEKFGLRSSDRLRKFESKGDHFTLLTIKPQNNKYPIIARNNANGTTFKFSSNYIQSLLSNQQPLANLPKKP